MEEEEEEGQWRGGQVGECGPPSGADCSRPSNHCHILSVRNIRREREGQREAERTPPPPPLPSLYPLPCPACSPPRPIRSIPLQGLGGEERDPSG